MIVRQEVYRGSSILKKLGDRSALIRFDQIPSGENISCASKDTFEDFSLIWESVRECKRERECVCERERECV